MTEFVLLVRWLLFGIGIVYFITESSVFSPFRIALTKGSDFRIGLLYCPACTGFWVGIIVSNLWVHQSDWSGIESGVAMMAVGAAWSNWRGGNSAYILEVVEEQHDSKEESEDGR